MDKVIVTKYSDLEALDEAEYEIEETGEIVWLSNIKFGYDGQALTLRAC
jgi:hypothetical protein